MLAACLENYAVRKPIIAPHTGASFAIDQVAMQQHDCHARTQEYPLHTAISHKFVILIGEFAAI